MGGGTAGRRRSRWCGRLLVRGVAVFGLVLLAGCGSVASPAAPATIPRTFPPATLVAGALTAVVTRSGSLAVGCVFDGAIAGVGIGKTLAPGESIPIDYLVGTASCDPTLGYTLPPGTYDVHVELLGDDMTNPPTLLLGAASQTIEVTLSQPPPVTLVSPEQTTQSTTTVSP